MKKIKFIKHFIFAGVLSLGLGSCTNLNEEVIDATLTTNADPDALLASAYNGLREFQQQDRMFALNEVSTDILIVPTRGGDWDDGGAWRQDHAHTWTATSREVSDSWKALLSSVYNCDLVLALNGVSDSKKAEALFLKSYYYYNVIDLYGKAPYRPAGSDPNDFPLVWGSTEATTTIIGWLEEALPNLPARTANDPSVANKDAAHFLLAKLYLNKAVFTDEDRIGPFTFASADMTKVVENVDAITNTLASDYWDNFKPANNTSPELIFTSKNILGVAMGEIRRRWYMSQHYNSTPGGWNGFSVLGDFYDSFDPNDRRIKNNDPSIISSFGNPMGMQIGQQYAPGGVTPLSTRAQNGSLPLAFSHEVSLVISDADHLERGGIRPMKYIPDMSNLDKPENDYVLFRYADALLMKAEAIARGGAGTLGGAADALATRANTSVTYDLSNLSDIYKARGHELWEEGWRRNDMIRFGTFLAGRPTKPTSDNKCTLYPIPASALVNPNITQNLGY